MATTALDRKRKSNACPIDSLCLDGHQKLGWQRGRDPEEVLFGYGFLATC